MDPPLGLNCCRLWTITRMYTSFNIVLISYWLMILDYLYQHGRVYTYILYSDQGSNCFGNDLSSTLLNALAVWITVWTAWSSIAWRAGFSGIAFNPPYKALDDMSDMLSEVGWGGRKGSVKGSPQQLGSRWRDKTPSDRSLEEVCFLWPCTSTYARKTKVDTEYLNIR